MNSHQSETTSVLEILLKTVQKAILKKEQDWHLMQVKEDFLDSKIRVKLDDLHVMAPKKKTSRQRVALILIVHDTDFHVF